jgi:uncharacterized protein YbbK (DUF523 family)
MATLRKPRLGVSACLLGEAVRYDGRSKRDRLLLETLGAHVEWVPVCPEVELGLGVPREPIELVGRGDAPRLVGVVSRVEHTAAMRGLATRRARDLASLGLDGWVAKARSPSCAVRGVPVHPTRGGATARRGAGAFARVLRKRLPGLPVVDEVGLADPGIRRRFLARVRAHARRREKAPLARRKGG